jgi:hypothetical protein
METRASYIPVAVFMLLPLAGGIGYARRSAIVDYCCDA